MIPSASLQKTLPAPAPEQSNLPSSTDSDSSADANTPSFASHLDHFVMPAHQQSGGPSAQRLAATLAQPRADKTAQKAPQKASAVADAQVSDATQDQAVPIPADNAHAPNDASKSAVKSVVVSSENKDITKEDTTKEDTKTSQDTQTVAAPAVSAAPLPLTTVNLAITNGVAPLPVPIQQTPLSVQQTPVPVQQANDTNSLPNVAATSTSTLVPGASFPADPLNIPGVSMDLRSAVQTAVPGVVNALPQNSAVSASVSLPAVSAQTPPATNIPTSNSAILPATPVTAPSVINAPAALIISANPVQQTTLQQGTAKHTDTLKAATAIPQADNLSQETVTDSTIQSSAEKAIGGTEENSAEVSIPGISTTEQHLGGIERLFTLGANKSVVAGSAQSTELGTGTSDTPAATPASAATLLTQNASNRQQIAVALASQVYQTTAHDAAALAQLPSLASGQTPAILTPLAAATLAASIAGKTGALSQPIDAIRDSNGTTALSATDIATGTTSETGGIQIASFGAQGKTDGEAFADSESQADSHHDEAASSAAEHNTDITAQTNSANPFSSLKAPGEIAAANVVTNPTGSGQIARTQIVEQVTRHLESMRISNGEGEMRLRLAPAHLGNVQISVETHQNGVTARIAVESAQIQQAMEGAKEHLRTSLEARGLHVNSVEVTVTPNLIGSGGAAFAGERGWQPTGDRAEAQSGYSRPNNTGQASDDSPDAVPTAIPATHVSHSRLDYRA